MQKSHTAGTGNLTGTVVDRVYTVDEAGERCRIAGQDKIAQVHLHSIREAGLTAGPARKHTHGITSRDVPQHETSPDETGSASNRYSHEEHRSSQRTDAAPFRKYDLVFWSNPSLTVGAPIRAATVRERSFDTSP